MAKLLLLAAVVALPLSSWAQAVQNEETVTVTATGTVVLEPEGAVLLIQAEAFDTVAAEAAAQSREVLDRALQSVRALGIVTFVHSLPPTLEEAVEKYSEPKQGTGNYRAYETVRITVPRYSAAMVGAAVDLAEELGVFSPRAFANRQRTEIVMHVATFAESATAAAREHEVRVDRIVAEMQALSTETVQVHRNDYNVGDARSGQWRIERELSGFRARHAAQVLIDDPGRASSAVDAALSAGASKVSPIAFGLHDADAAYGSALERATTNAVEQARVTAEAAGARLGKLLRVQTTSPPEAPAYDLANAAGTPRTRPVEAGLIRITATVTLEYELKR